MKQKLLLLFALSFLSTGMFAQDDYCLQFDGVASRVKYANETNLDALDGATDYTIEAWFYPTDADIHNRVIVKRWYQFAITMYQNDNLRVYFTHYSNDGADKIFVNSLYNVVNLNEWNHVAVINNSADNSLKLYVNGVDVTADASGTATTQDALPLDANMPADANFYIGYGGTDTVPFAYIDKVRVLTVAEDIANLNTNDPLLQAYTPDANTVALFNMDEGSGDRTVNHATGIDANLECSGGCAEIPTWELVQNTVTGVDEFNSIEFSIYPNPASNGNFSITTAENQAIQKVSITDMSGKIVYEKEMNNKHSSVQIQSRLSNGYYLLMSETEKGKAVSKLWVQ